MEVVIDCIETQISVIPTCHDEQCDIDKNKSDLSPSNIPSHRSRGSTATAHPWLEIAQDGCYCKLFKERACASGPWITVPLSKVNPKKLYLRAAVARIKCSYNPV